MDTDWFREALNRAGHSQADLARYLGLPPSAISRMVSGARQMKLLEAVQTAVFLGVPQEEMLRRAGDGPSLAPADTTPARRGRPPRQSPSQPPMLRPDTIPIRSATPRSRNQQMFMETDPTGYTSRPANLAGVRGAYAIYMVGGAMEPRYEQGWLLHVHPFKPPTRGRDVVVHQKDKAVLIKQFVGWSDDTLIVRQLNPEETLRIPRDEILECHLIVGVDQEG